MPQTGANFSNTRIESGRDAVRRGLLAGAVAGLVSGAPSTVHALVTGRDPLAAARAAGTLVLPAGAPPGRLLVAGAVAHTSISLGWGTVVSVALPGLSRLSIVAAAAWGGAAGLAIAALDLGVFGRHRPPVRALPLWPQVADHVAFGLVTGALLAERPGG
jgi:hypothetical protein